VKSTSSSPLFHDMTQVDLEMKIRRRAFANIWSSSENTATTERGKTDRVIIHHASRPLGVSGCMGTATAERGLGPPMCNVVLS
jgi:hypothetical protein